MKFLKNEFIILIMKIRKEIDELWEELKDWDGKWNDDDIFESISVDDFLDEVNEMYEMKFGRGGWVLLDYYVEGNEVFERE